MQDEGLADDLSYFKCPTPKQMRRPVNADPLFKILARCLTALISFAKVCKSEGADESKG
jgi:hypothetical protein